MGYLLPTGTVVKAKLSEEYSMRVMIVGHFPRNEKTKRIYEYATVLYPMGTTMRLSLQGLNHSSIQEVESLGYEDDDTKIYLEGLEQLIGAMKQKAMELQNDSRKEESKDTPKEENLKPLDEWFV